MIPKNGKDLEFLLAVSFQSFVYSVNFICEYFKGKTIRIMSVILLCKIISEGAIFGISKKQ